MTSNTLSLPARIGATLAAGAIALTTFAGSAFAGGVSLNHQVDIGGYEDSMMDDWCDQDWGSWLGSLCGNDVASYHDDDCDDHVVDHDEDEECDCDDTDVGGDNDSEDDDDSSSGGGIQNVDIDADASTTVNSTINATSENNVNVIQE